MLHVNFCSNSILCNKSYPDAGQEVVGPKITLEIPFSDIRCWCGENESISQYLEMVIKNNFWVGYLPRNLKVLGSALLPGICMNRCIMCNVALHFWYIGQTGSCFSFANINEGLWKSMLHKALHGVGIKMIAGIFPSFNKNK